VGLLDRFEQRLDRLVNGAFARAFKAEVQPVEVAAALQREIDDRAAVVSRGRTVVPNVFTVELSGHDFERLSTYTDPLRAELATMISDYAGEQSYTFLGPVDVELGRDDELETGIFRVRSEARPGVTAAPPATGVVTAATPALVISGTPYPLTRPVTVIGRGTDTDLRIDDPGVSRHHLQLALVPGQGVELRDLGSTNGTQVDGRPITTPVRLRDGALITVGTTEIVFRTG
jgi:hypothetical protein